MSAYKANNKKHLIEKIVMGLVYYNSILNQIRNTFMNAIYNFIY